MGAAPKKQTVSSLTNWAAGPLERLTSACTGLPTARFFKGYAPTTTLLIEIGLAGSAAGETRGYG